MNSEINSLWIGEFSNLEMLTLNSFSEKGHIFNLWVYSKPKIPLPKNVVIQDANEIIDQKEIFRYQGIGDCRKGSLGGFSDIFRYNLLYKKGGWYVDMDVTCLENFFDMEQEYVLRKHNKYGTVANIIKCPKESEFMKSLIEKTTIAINENNNDWVLPLKILDETVKSFNMEKYYAKDELFGDDSSDILKKIKNEMYFSIKDLIPLKAIHWCKEASHGLWDKRMRYDWNSPIPLTFYYNLLGKYSLLQKETKILPI
jgi:hypothetical protein